MHADALPVLQREASHIANTALHFPYTEHAPAPFQAATAARQSLTDHNYP